MHRAYLTAEHAETAEVRCATAGFATRARTASLRIPRSYPFTFVSFIDLRVLRGSVDC